MRPFFYRWVRSGTPPEHSLWDMTCPSLRAILQKQPNQRSGDLVILNIAYGVHVGMVIKLSGQIMHSNHVFGPGLGLEVMNLDSKHLRELD